MSKLDSMNATHRPARVVPGHLVWPAAAIVALAGAAPALAALTGLPMPGNSGPSTASASTRSSSTVSSSSSSSGMVAAGRTASAAGSAAAARAAPASTHAAPAPATVRVAAAPAPSARTSSPAVTSPAVLGRGQHTFIAAMTRAQPGASRQSPSQAVASNGGGRDAGASGGTNITTTPSSATAGTDAHGNDPRGVAIPSYQPPPGAERRHPMSSAARVGPGAGSDAPSGSASTAPAPDPSSSTQSHSPNRFAAGAGPTPDNASSTSSAPTRAAASGAVTETTARSTTRTAAAEARPAPLAEIVPTAAEWSDARRQASAARVVPLSQTQTLSGGTKVARTADCVPTTLVPDAKRPGQLSIGHSSRDLARSVSTTQDVARLFARTRFDGVDLGVSQSMCLPPDLASRLAQLPPTTGLAARPAMTLRAGKSRVEPATGAAG